MFNILVVEDNRDLRELLCDALTGEGYRAYFFFRRKRGFDTARRNLFRFYRECFA